MERRRQARTPVNINALLIGEKTVPKGCQVINVSQNGMQLQCSADGRLLTFNEGDSVDVHLTIQHEGKQKKIAIPSWVRHVAANSIDVEFHQPDPQLVDLIESYRVSEQHKLEASLGRMDRRIASNRPSGNEKLPAQAAKPAQKQNNRPFYSLILAIVFAVCVITGGYVYTASIDSRISTLETLSKRHSTELAEMQNRIFSASLQEGRYASLNARMSAIVDAIVSLEDRLSPDRANSAGAPLHDKLRTAKIPPGEHKLKDTATGSMSVAAEDSGSASARRQDISVPKTAIHEVAETASMEPTNQATSPVAPPAAVPGETDIPASKTTRQTSTLAATASAEGTTPIIDRTDSATGTTQRIESSEAPAHDGPWVINLLSSRDRAYVEQFSKKSDAARYSAVLNSAMVKGKQYWRLQITGFDSAAAARKRAETVKQELGIKDVWIFKQK